MSDTSHLPLLIQELEEEIGLPATVKLVESFGGVRVFIPKNATPRLTTLLGDEAAARLVKLYGGEMIPVPRCVAAIRQKRNADLLAKREGGMSLRQLALAFSLSERHVCRILVAGPDDDRQLRLFR